MSTRDPYLLTVSGQDGPGISARLCGQLARLGTSVLDVEQVRVHGRLLLCVEIDGGPATEADVLAESVAAIFAGDRIAVTISPLLESEGAAEGERFLVTVLAPQVEAATLEGISRRIADCGGNIERIIRLASYPVHSYELSVAGGDLDRLRRDLADVAVRSQVDIAVQVAGLHRRAKHLIVLDADSTLLQGEVIDLLAARCGCGSEVAAVTAAAMAGEIDFEQALRRRVALLAGMTEADLDAVRQALVLTPGARTLVRTLKRLGYAIAVVSGGFTQLIDDIVDGLGIDH